MSKIHLIVQVLVVLGIITLVSSAPTWSQHQALQPQLQRFVDKEFGYGDEDYSESSQQQVQSEDLSQYQQGQIQLGSQSAKLEEFGQETDSEDLNQVLQQQSQLQQQSEDLLDDSQQLTQSEDLLDGTQQLVQSEDLLDDSQQQSENLEQYQQGQIQSGKLEDWGMPQESEIQQTQVEDLSQFSHQQGGVDNEVETGDYDGISHKKSQSKAVRQYEQGEIQLGSPSARLEDLGQETEDFQQNQDHDAILRDYQQETDSEDLNQFLQQLSQVEKKESEDLLEDSQQQTQSEDLLDGSQQVQSEDLLDDSQQQTQSEDLLDGSQQVQSEDLLEDSQQQTQSEDLLDGSQQVQSEELLEDSQQQSQSENLEQYQQGQIQSGRLEDLGGEVEVPEESEIQQTQVEDLSQFPQQLGQESEGYNVQQTQDHEDMVDESQQQSQVEVEELNQGQIQLGSPSGRLEDFSDDKVQQTAVEDQFQQGQIPSLEVSQIRHEESPFGYAPPPIDSQDLGPAESSLDTEIEYPEEKEGRQGSIQTGSQTPQEELDGIERDSDKNVIGQAHDVHSKNENFDLLFTTSRPGFWRRLGNSIEDTYNKAKNKATHVINTVREKVG